ncbi:hypothetical protein [uncultured Aquimarina sp.]|uniref:hypothetical protein n=1 Tax=uncultured Aquimarina sp. TaxID=575652 RepID=UPI00261E882F|nr:hypothetical protein [uncultured Aquimarina sp.]
MKLKKDPYKKKTKLLLVALLLGALVITVLFSNKVSGDAVTSKKTNRNQTDTPTTAIAEYSISEMIKKDQNIIYSDSEFSILYNKKQGVPTIYYVYKDTLTHRQLIDRFFIHIYPKDEQTLLKHQPYNFLNMDFENKKPLELTINGKKYFVFQRPFVHKSLGEFLKNENIKFINTGRFSYLGRSYEASNIRFKNFHGTASPDILPKLNITINKKSFDKIKAKRDNALKSIILSKSDEDFVKADVSFNNSESVKSKLRLKGDWTDHLDDHKKWSFRVIIEEDEKTIRRMGKFSLQHPKARNYEWEWLFNKVIKDNDIIGLRYDFIDVKLKITNKDSSDLIHMGIMAMEESFDKRLIESNKKREGVILTFDETPLWNDRKSTFDKMISQKFRNQSLQSMQKMPIKVFDESRILSDPVLSKQFYIAKDLLDALRKGKVKISEVFDIDKLTTYVALSNLFGGQHGLYDHNLRIYYNPITNKLEPISFDSHSGLRISKIANYPFSEDDPIYTAKLLEKLQLVSSNEFIKNIIHKFKDDLNTQFNIVNTELNTTVNLSILDDNSNFIKKQITPPDIVFSNLINISDNQIELSVRNISNFPVTIKGIVHSKGNNLTKVLSKKEVISPNQEKIIHLYLKDAFQNAFVSKKNKKGGFRYPKDVKKLKLKFQLEGLSFTREADIIPFGSTEQKMAQSIQYYKTSKQANYKNFKLLKISGNQIIFQKGKYTLEQTLTIPNNFQIIVEPGFELDLRNNASIISNSPLLCEGTKESPIRFFSSDGTGGGIFISDVKKKSIVNYCYFDNLSNPNSKIWSLSGAVNFHETVVEIRNSIFKNNRCEDGLNIIRSKFLIDATIFENTFSDAFDGDFVEGDISNSSFFNSGNDGIDISGSSITVNNVTIKNSSDKAISAGELSNINGNNIVVTDGEIGIVSKDLSYISLQNVKISNTKLGLSSFQKKSEYGTGYIEISKLTLIDNTLNYLIENGSQLLINNTPVETVSNKVLDQMYGNEYGKSSK